MADPGEVLLLGNAGAGKTTLLTQLYGRMQAGTGRLRARRAPITIGPIRSAMQRLEQGLSVEHTSHSTDVELVLHALDSSGRSVDVVLPDYAGETLDDVVTNRRVPAAWQRRVLHAEHWVLLLRLSQHTSLPDVINRPMANPHSDGTAEHAGVRDVALPLDLWAVELLQILLHCRRTQGSRQSLPRLTIALSCWDEFDRSDGVTPDQELRRRTALVADFAAAHWAERPPEVVGLSAQGQSLSRDQEAAKFVDLGPQQLGWLVLPDGARDPDLTRLLTGR